MQQVEMFTDGACLGNPGPGGWGVLLRCDGIETQLQGGLAHTTNNQMEMQAAIEGLASLTEPCQVVLTTDSQYVRLGMTEWMPKWQRNGWRRADGGAVKNVELWQRLVELAEFHQVSWHWVKGHSGHRENEIVDQLAYQAAQAQTK